MYQHHTLTPAPVLCSSRKLQVKLCSHDDGQSLATHDNILDDSSCFKHLAEIMSSEEPSPCRSFTRKQRKKRKIKAHNLTLF